MMEEGDGKSLNEDAHLEAIQFSVFCETIDSKSPHSACDIMRYYRLVAGKSEVFGPNSLQECRESARRNCRITREELD